MCSRVPDHYQCQSWNVAAKVIIKQSFRYKNDEDQVEQIYDDDDEDQREQIYENDENEDGSEHFVTALEDRESSLSVTEHSPSDIYSASQTLIPEDNTKKALGKNIATLVNDDKRSQVTHDEDNQSQTMLVKCESNNKIRSRTFKHISTSVTEHLPSDICTTYDTLLVGKDLNVEDDITGSVTNLNDSDKTNIIYDESQTLLIRSTSNSSFDLPILKDTTSKIDCPLSDTILCEKISSKTTERGENNFEIGVESLSETFVPTKNSEGESFDNIDISSLQNNRENVTSKSPQYDLNSTHDSKVASLIKSTPTFKYESKNYQNVDTVLLPSHDIQTEQRNQLETKFYKEDKPKNVDISNNLDTLKSVTQTENYEILNPIFSEHGKNFNKENELGTVQLTATNADHFDYKSDLFSKLKARYENVAYSQFPSYTTIDKLINKKISNADEGDNEKQSMGTTKEKTIKVPQKKVDNYLNIDIEDNADNEDKKKHTIGTTKELIKAPKNQVYNDLNIDIYESISRPPTAKNKITSNSIKEVSTVTTDLSTEDCELKDSSKYYDDNNIYEDIKPIRTKRKKGRNKLVDYQLQDTANSVVLQHNSASKKDSNVEVPKHLCDTHKRNVKIKDNNRSKVTLENQDEQSYRNKLRDKRKNMFSMPTVFPWWIAKHFFWKRKPESMNVSSVPRRQNAKNKL